MHCLQLNRAVCTLCGSIVAALGETCWFLLLPPRFLTAMPPRRVPLHVARPRVLRRFVLYDKYTEPVTSGDFAWMVTGFPRTGTHESMCLSLSAAPCRSRSPINPRKSETVRSGPPSILVIASRQRLLPLAASVFFNEIFEHF